MPEGPEVRVIVDAISSIINTNFIGAKIIENAPGALHRYSREKPKNWELIANNSWKILNIRTKGKLIIFDIEASPTLKLCLLATLGMSGDFRFNSIKHKHCRYSLIKENGEDISFIDPRCFGSLRIVFPNEATKLEAKIGHDLLQSPMNQDQWIKLQNHYKIANQEIKPALMTQNLFSSLGNIYACETLYELAINPKTFVSKLDPNKWMQINQTAHDILQKAYKLNGSSVKDFTYNGNQGNAQTILKVYGRQYCPKGYKIQTIQQEGRTTWFVKELQLA